MKWIATLANFFFPGLGYIISGQKRLLGVGWFIAALGLTYVELSLQGPMPNLYWAMFASVFLANTMFAIDVYRTFDQPEASAALKHA